VTGVVTYIRSPVGAAAVAAVVLAIDQMTVAATAAPATIIPTTTATTAPIPMVLAEEITDVLVVVSFSETERTGLCRFGYMVMSSRTVG